MLLGLSDYNIRQTLSRTRGSTNSSGSTHFGSRKSSSSGSTANPAHKVALRCPFPECVCVPFVTLRQAVQVRISVVFVYFECLLGSFSVFFPLLFFSKRAAHVAPLHCVYVHFLKLVGIFPTPPSPHLPRVPCHAATRLWIAFSFSPHSRTPSPGLFRFSRTYFLFSACRHGLGLRAAVGAAGARSDVARRSRHGRRGAKAATRMVRRR